jgi:hypothetical protein
MSSIFKKHYFKTMTGIFVTQTAMSSASPDGGNHSTGTTGMILTRVPNPFAITMVWDALMAFADHLIIALVRWVGKVPIAKLASPCPDVITVPAKRNLSATVTMDMQEPIVTFVSHAPTIITGVALYNHIFMLIPSTS